MWLLGLVSYHGISSPPTHHRHTTGSYNDITGQKTLLHRQQATIQFDGLITIDVVVHGNTFTFYLNGQRQGTVQNALYPNGTIGFAVNIGADIFFRNLAIYNLPTTT
jgi:hypothetical protein